MTTDFIVAFLATYLIHSSLLLGTAWLIVRTVAWARADLLTPAHRAALWKTALVGGIVTSLANVALPLPHWGTTWLLSSTDSTQQLDPLPPLVLDAAATTSTARPPTSVMEPAPDEAWSLAEAWREFDARSWVVRLWGVACVAALLNFLRHRWALNLLTVAGRPVAAGPLRDITDRLTARFGLRRRVALYLTAGCEGPMAAGWLRPRVILPRAFLASLDDEQLEGLLAHELAHLARRDPLWNSVAHLIGGIFFFQPLNRWARRELLFESELLADQLAAATPADRVALARCLTAFGEWQLEHRPTQVAWHAAAVGMGAFRSPLGRRVELLFEPGLSQRSGRVSPWLARTLWSAAVLLTIAGTVLSAPRVLTTSLSPPTDAEGSPPMNRLAQLGTAAVLTSALMLPASAADSAPKVDTVPEAMHGFRGSLIGKLLTKDVEKGTFTAKVERVDQTFRPNKAKDPQAGIGKTFSLFGVSGKYLDVLITVEPGDTVRFACFHREGDRLEFIGENMFTKVAPDAPEQKKTEQKKEQPAPQSAEKSPAADQASPEGVPAGLVGFRGVLRGKFVSGDAEKGTLVVAVEAVPKVWKLNKATEPNSAVGKQIRVEGVFGKFLDVLLTLEKGDLIEVEANHNGGNGLRFPGEWLKKVN